MATNETRHLVSVLEAAAVSAFALMLCYFASEQLHQISGLDLLVISVASAVLAKILASFFRSPSQFVAALWQRIAFIIWTPIAVLAMVVLFLIRVGFLVFKLSFKLLIWAIVGLAYLILPIDLIPDFILVLGQIDDILLIVGLAFWFFSASSMIELRASIRSRRPKVPFP
jgi:hypothetical protein